MPARSARLDLDLFVNVRFKSDLPGCGRRNVYYCMFPHRLQVESAGRAHALYLWAASALERALVVRHRGGFLATYDEVWAISRVHGSARGGALRGRRPLLVYPACEPVPRGVKQRVIAVVGRFQTPGPNIPYKAQDVLLRVFATLTDLHAQGWRLVMVGGTSPEGSSELSGLRELAQGLPVTFVTDGSREQVRDILGEASLYWHAQGVERRRRALPGEPGALRHQHRGGDVGRCHPPRLRHGGPGRGRDGGAGRDQLETAGRAG